VGATVRVARARPIDISRGGAFLVADTWPAGSPPAVIRIALAGPWPTDWVGATVVEITRAPDGLHHLRVAFRRPCPDGFLRAAFMR
jgi:hypothetical protein